MNIRLLGVLLCLIGMAFAYHSMGQKNLANQQYAAMDIQDYYLKTTGTVFRDELVGVSRGDLKKRRDDAQQSMALGLLLAAVGFAVAVAAKKHGASERKK